MSARPRPEITRCQRVVGKNLVFRDVEVEDAEFILALRLQDGKKRFLSPTPESIDHQVEWIQRYKAGNGQAYFVICDNRLHSLGCVRIYDAEGDSFCWGSWILTSGLPPHVALESAVLVYRLATDIFGFGRARLQVRKENRLVWTFHERVFNAVRTGETNEDYLYEVSEAAICTAVAKYRALLPSTLQLIS